MSDAADVALTQSDEDFKPPVKVAGVSARQAAAGLVALVLAFLAGKWSASSPAPAPAAADPPDLGEQGSGASLQPTAGERLKLSQARPSGLLPSLQAKLLRTRPRRPLVACALFAPTPRIDDSTNP